MGKDNLISDAGVIYPSGMKETLDSVVSWHDVPPLRIWVSSRKANSEDSPREITSIEFQYVGINPTRVGSEEKRMRLKLLGFQNLSIDTSPDLDPQIIRRIPTGRVIEDHARIVGEAVFGLMSLSEKSVELVSEVKTHSRSSSKKSIKPILNRNNQVLGNSNEDSILISYVYAIQTTTGVSKLAKRTAEILGIDVNTVHVALKIARRNGWLTSFGAGKAGGQLTESGLLIFETYDGPKRYEDIIRKRSGI